MSSKKQQIPSFRFEGFTDAWEQRRFSSIVNRVSAQSNDSNLPKVEFEDIISGEGRLNKDISQKFDSRKGTVFEPEFILYGKLRPYLKNWLFPDFKGIALGDFWVFEPNNSSSIFDYYLIQSDKYQTVANLSSGTKMPRSDWKTVSETYFDIPNSIEEQKKIGTFFKQLDDIIALHQSRLMLLNQLKEAYLYNMLPQNREREPEIRFNEFRETWKRRKLADILQERNIKQIPTNNFPLVSFTVESGVTPKSDRYNREFLVRDDNKKYKLTKFNDIVYNPANLKFGAISRNKLGNAVFSPIYITFETNNNPEFVELIVTQKSFIKKALKYQQGTVYERQAVKPEDLLTMSVLLPSEKEQIEIGNFFNRLDDAIAFQQKRIYNFQQLKEKMIHQMFV